MIRHRPATSCDARAKRSPCPFDDPRLPDTLLQFARNAVATWTPHDVFALDVARVEGRYAIVEANRFNGSRLYGAHVTDLVRAISAYQQRNW